MIKPPSGEQFVLRAGSQQATIVEVGGGIREYRDGDVDVLQSYAADSMCDGAHGAPLIPWPNRLADGKYSFDGEDYQVGLTEPDKHNAIHGFLQWRPWRPIDQADDRITMAAALFPLEGYPFALDLQIAYQLTDEGLTVTTTATNVGDRPCPYGCGQHPYLSPGDGLVDDCTVQLQAATRICTDPQRELPTGTEAVAGTAFDLRAPRHLGTLEIDYAFTDLTRDDDGLAWVRLARPDGHVAALWVDETFPIIELYTADTLSPDRRRRGLGTEPMSCPPNALQSGQHVLRLDPGESTTHTWGAQLHKVSDATA